MLRHIFMLIVSLSLPLITQAQFCTGTLGDNIFLEGDFGTGPANLLSPNPNIAPGYAYTFNVPPLDGEYVLTNNTASWPGLFGTWLGIGDNSGEPNGYMMVVNASNAPGLFYEQTVSGLCENTLYEFSADIINLIKVGTSDHIDSDVSFVLDGVELFSTGDIPKTNSWTTYGFTFTTALGQQSLTLSLRNNAPGGIGNDLAIDNISFRACGPEIVISPTGSVINLCEGDEPIEFQAAITGNQYINPAFQWQQSLDEGLTWVDIVGANDATYTHPPLTAGIYYYRFLIADGIGNLSSDKCRVSSDPKIINVPITETMQTETICEGLTLTVGNSIYSESGTYMDSFVSSLGCDSIVITDLTVVINSDFMAELLITTPCANVSDGIISVENISNGIPPFNYTFEGVDFGVNNTFPGLAAGESYSVIIQDDIGCSIELSAFIENPSDLILELGEDQTIELGETVNVSPAYNFTPSDFNWQTITPIDCIDFEDCEQLSFIPTTSQQVTLELFAGDGCSVSDSIFIEVIKVRKVWLPNAFSPNGDGINDFFTVYGKTSNVQMVEEFKVFDRWGGFVFEGKDFLPNVTLNGWDGTFNGKDLPLGTYIYTTTIRFVDGVVLRYSGDVSIVK
ncbi:MAG: gliding motility-associated-like protein [Ulvibacter sp.]|jgi:gliding motility-associated-like protein